MHPFFICNQDSVKAKLKSLIKQEPMLMAGQNITEMIILMKFGY